MTTADVVYFVQFAHEGPVKIGFTSNLEQRLASFQTALPWDVVLIRSEPGDLRLERAFHRWFRERHLRGEWFDYDPAMLSVSVADVLPDYAAPQIRRWTKEPIAVTVIEDLRIIGRLAYTRDGKPYTT